MKTLTRSLMFAAAAATLMMGADAQAQSRNAEAFIGTYLPVNVTSYEVVGEQIPSFQRAVLPCYTEQLLRSPGLTGMVVMEFHVSTSGEIFNVAVLDNRTGSSALASCAQQRIQAVRMPANLGHNVRITLPVSFVNRVAQAPRDGQMEEVTVVAPEGAALREEEAAA